jgi:DNA primase
MKPLDFTIDNMTARLQEKGDLWERLHNARVKSANSKVLRKILGG